MPKGPKRQKKKLIAKVVSLKSRMKFYKRMDKRFGGYQKIVRAVEQEMEYWRQRAGM
jgi:hypothetical protein